MAVDFLVQVDGFVVRKPVAFCEQHVGEGQVKAVEACAGAGLVTTQFYSVDLSQSRIGVNKCVFYKRTIKVCVSCC